MADLTALKPRSGTDKLGVYEPGRPVDEVARELGLDPNHMIKLASNENAWGPSPAAVEAMRDAALQMHLYPDGGAFYLRKALAEKLGVDPEMLIFGNGSNELIEFLGHLFLEPGCNAVMSDRAFIMYKLIAALFGAEARPAPMADGFTHDLDAMRALVDEQTRLVFVANPNNPTGTKVRPEPLKAFIDSLPEQTLPVLDEAYIELLPPAERPDAIAWLKEDRPLLILRTFSKAYGLAGLRIGYGIGDAGLIRWLEKYRQPFNCNAMAQAAALASIQDDAYENLIRERTRASLIQLEEGCAALGFDVVPSSTNFLLVRTGESRKHFQALQKLGVVVRPMDGYGLREYVRITVGTEQENLRALAALKELRA